MLMYHHDDEECLNIHSRDFDNHLSFLKEENSLKSYEHVQRDDREWILISVIYRRVMNWQENERNLLTRNDIHERNEEHVNDEFDFQDKLRRVIHDVEMNKMFSDRDHRLFVYHEIL